MLYSQTTNGFYHPSIHGGDIPADAVSVTDAEYAALMDGQVNGLVIAPDVNGRPTSVSPPPASAIPQVVTRFQARAALHLAGLLEQVEALMAHPDTPMLAKLAWSDAMEFRRTSPTIASLASTLGLSDAALDDLFTVAAGIDA